MNKYINYKRYKRLKNKRNISKAIGKKSTNDKKLIESIIFFIIISVSIIIGICIDFPDDKIPLAELSVFIIFIGSILYLLFLSIVVGHDKPRIYYYPNFELKKIHLLPWVVFFSFFSCLGIIGKIFGI